jgi:hypothetical protein
MEVPDLSSSTIWCLKGEVSVIDDIKIFVCFHLRYDIEVSFDNESEIFVEFSLLWFTLPFINVDNVPLLVDSTVLVVNSDVSVFLINISNNV